MPNGDQRIGRRNPRLPITAPVTLMVDPQGKRVPFACKTIDVSDTGLRLRGKTWPTPGVIVEVLSAAHPTLIVRGSVVWVKKVSWSSEVEIGIALGQPITAMSWLPRRSSAA